MQQDAEDVDEDQGWDHWAMPPVINQAIQGGDFMELNDLLGPGQNDGAPL